MKNNFAPKITQMRGMNWDALQTGFGKKEKVGQFVSILERKRSPQVPSEQTIKYRAKIHQVRRTRALTSQIRSVNQKLGGNCVGVIGGKPTTIQFWGNGAISVHGKLRKNPLNS